MKRAMALGIVLATGLACQKKAPAPDAGSAQGATAAAAPAPGGVVAEAMSLLQAGQLDEALARLDASSGDPAQLALLGAVWAKKAETAPLPTPPPLPSAAAKRATPLPAPEFKPEELTALGFLDRALQAQPGQPLASLTLAQLLGSHAARRFDMERAAVSAKRGRPKAAAPEIGAAGPDYGLDRVLGAYRDAVANTPASKEAVEKMYDFAVRVGRIDDAQWALDQLLAREREKPEPLVRYGDFLRDHRKEPHKAIERYREALIWRAGDEDVLGRIADIYVNEGIEAFDKHQWAVTEARLQEARKYVKNPNSPQGLRIRDYESRLAAIRRAR